MKYLLIIIFIFSSCKKNDLSEVVNSDKVTPCKGTWTVEDEFGIKNKYEQFWHSGLNGCVTEERTLSHFEESLRKRALRNIKCKPQNDFPSVNLISAFNYYKFRDGKIFLSLNSEEGEFRRLVIGTDESGSQTFSRDVGCFFVREDREIEPYLNQDRDHGLQILLDLELAASSSLFHPMEVYRVLSESSTSLELTRFDDNSMVSWMSCSSNSYPGYCDELDNGSIMYYPEGLPLETRDKLQATAILQRSEFNFEKITLDDFEYEWNYQIETTKETSLGQGWEYFIMGHADVPSYIHRAYRDYIMGNRRYMPDTQAIKIPPICYRTTKKITYEDGGVGYVKGQACYQGDSYYFVQI